MKKTILLCGFLMFLIGCENNEDQQALSTISKLNETETITYLENYIMPEKHIQAFQALGYAGYDVLPVETKNNATGLKKISYIVDGDMEIDEDQLFSLLDLQDSDNGRSNQYRTTITARPSNYKISVANITGGTRTALNRAIENFNLQNTGISFEVKYPEEFNGAKDYHQSWGQKAHIVVGIRNFGGGGGSSGFPYANGFPYKYVYIDPKTNSNYGLDVTEHILTHELGHCIGFRHTDYFNRSLSCGRGGNEGDGDVGAVHIPGTPDMIVIDKNSIMKSCFNGTETGEFTQSDILSLNALF